MKNKLYLCFAVVFFLFLTNCNIYRNEYEGFSYVPNEEGKKNGQAVHYDNQGNLRRKEYFIDNLAEGEVVEYYSNGTLKRKGSFKNGIANGIFKYYDTLGYLEMLVTVVDGLKEGKTIFYDTLGFPKSLLNYKKNKLLSQLILDSLDNTKIKNIINFYEDKFIIFNKNQTIDIDNSKFITTTNHKDTITYGETYISDFSLHIGKSILRHFFLNIPMERLFVGFECQAIHSLYIPLRELILSVG